MEKYTNEGGGELDSTNKDCSRDSLRLKNYFNPLVGPLKIIMKIIIKDIIKRLSHFKCVFSNSKRGIDKIWGKQQQEISRVKDSQYDNHT